MSKALQPKRLLEVEALQPISLTRTLSSRAGRTRWALVLMWFCRLCATVWLFAGLLHWAFILGVIVIPGSSFETSAPPAKMAEIAFAVVDLIAAVGLWLTASWGAPVWFLAAAAQVALPFVLHDYGGGTPLVIAINTLLICIYIFLNYVSNRTSRNI